MTELFPEPLRHELTRSQMDRILLWCVEKRASDIVFCPGDPVWMEQDGVWRRVTDAGLTPSETERIVNETTMQASRAGYVRSGRSTDYAYQTRVPESRGVWQRFRVNATSTSKGIYIVMRALPRAIPTLGDMEGIDDSLRRALYPASGLVCVSGVMGSGKSTLTHAKHGGKYPSIKVLHDDAFIINSDTCASIALEPTYFDKTADYPVDSPDNKYLLTAQNCSATLDEDGKVVLVTEDVRNGNGRAIKSKLWSPNRVDKIESPVNAIFWIMKDPTIPPIVKLKGASLASVMGATLATKRSSAERLKEGVDPNALVVEPYANPFRTYPLVNDYEKFKKLVAEKNVACYIINTGDFMGKKVQKEDTLGILEAVVEGRAEFKPWGPFSDIEIMEWDGFVPDLTDKGYVAQMQARMQDRLNYVEGLKDAEGGFNALPDDAADAIRKVVEQANSL